jgi:hypothetical protein
LCLTEFHPLASLWDLTFDWKGMLHVKDCGSEIWVEEASMDADFERQGKKIHSHWTSKFFPLWPKLSNHHFEFKILCCMFVYYPKYGARCYWKSMGVMEKWEIDGESMKTRFSTVTTRSGAWNSPWRAWQQSLRSPAEAWRSPAECWRSPAGKLRWLAEKLWWPAGKLRWLAGSCGEVLPPLGKSF